MSDLRSAAVLDSLYLLAVLSAVVFGGLAQLALAVPVAGVVGLRAMHRRRAPLLLSATGNPQ